jgi:hypothetical protein
VSGTLLGLVTRYYFLSEGCCLKVAVLCLWGALSDERAGLQLAVQSLSGLSHVEPVTPPTWRARFLYLYPPRNRVAQLHLRALDSLYVASCDWHGYGGGILALPQPGGPGIRIYISLRNSMVQSKVKAKSQSHVTTDGRLVSQSVLVPSPRGHAGLSSLLKIWFLLAKSLCRRSHVSGLTVAPRPKELGCTPRSRRRAKIRRRRSSGRPVLARLSELST